eukprot:GILI01034342.1.p1 GENE.GILI01034342.1~~GILI01034342.1.p1  ORF type:complete len:304 (+),score=49.77 GILI01034342.1:26-937(+)
MSSESESPELIDFFSGPLQTESIVQTPSKRPRTNAASVSQAEKKVFWTPRQENESSIAPVFHSHRKVQEKISATASASGAINDRKLLVLKSQLACFSREELEDLILEQVAAFPVISDRIRERWLRTISVSNIQSSSSSSGRVASSGVPPSSVIPSASTSSFKDSFIIPRPTARSSPLASDPFKEPEMSSVSVQLTPTPKAITPVPFSSSSSSSQSSSDSAVPPFIAYINSSNPSAADISPLKARSNLFDQMELVEKMVLEEKNQMKSEQSPLKHLLEGGLLTSSVSSSSSSSSLPSSAPETSE